MTKTLALLALLACSAAACGGEAPQPDPSPKTEATTTKTSALNQAWLVWGNGTLVFPDQPTGRTWSLNALSYVTGVYIDHYGTWPHNVDTQFISVSFWALSASQNWYWLTANSHPQPPSHAPDYAVWRSGYDSSIIMWEVVDPEGEVWQGSCNETRPHLVPDNVWTTLECAIGRDNLRGIGIMTRPQP